MFPPHTYVRCHIQRTIFSFLRKSTQKLNGMCGREPNNGELARWRQHTIAYNLANAFAKRNTSSWVCKSFLRRQLRLISMGAIAKWRNKYLMYARSVLKWLLICGGKWLEVFANMEHGEGQYYVDWAG